MITPPRYKTARRLGASIYEKTQTPKFALRSERKAGRREFSRPKTDYGVKVLEKQRVRFSYGIGERQFARYVGRVNESHDKNRSGKLFEQLELRLDNVVFRAGFAPSRQAARQMVAHGHITVNGKRVNIPSYQSAVGDSIAIRERTKNTKLLTGLPERLADATRPGWLTLTLEKLEVSIQNPPIPEQPEILSQLGSVLEFYRR